MADPKQVVYTPVDISDGEYADFERDPKLEEENAEFDAFKSEMHESQDDAKITVGKKLTDSRGRPLGRQTFECFECGIDDYTFSQLCTRIREDFGTGLYTVLGRNSKGAYKFRKTVGILAPQSTDNVPAGADVGALIDKMSDAMERNAMRTEQMFKNLVGPQTGGDAFTQMTGMMAAMGNMMKGFGITPQPQALPKTLVEQLTEFKMIKELFGGDGDGDSGDANIFSLLGKTVDAFGGPIATALAQASQSGALDESGIMAQPALPAPNPTLAEKTTNEEKANMAMRKNIHVLIQNAKAETDPVLFAGVLINATPESDQDKLWDFISDPDCIEKIIKLEPVAEQYREWFDALRDAVIEVMAEPEKELPVEVDESILPESHAVAGGESDTSTDAKSDGDTPSDT